MKWERFLIKNSLILGTKLNVLNNILLRAEREVHFPREHPFFFIASMLRASQRRYQFKDKLSFQKQRSQEDFTWVQPKVGFKKSSQQTRTGFLCLLQSFQLHGSTCQAFGYLVIVPKNNHFCFHGTRQVEPVMLYCPKRTFAKPSLFEALHLFFLPPFDIMERHLIL